MTAPEPEQIPCWNAECTGTIPLHAETRRRVCSACGRRLPTADDVTRSVILFLVLLVLAVVGGLGMFVYGAFFSLPHR